jgi:hypothetical protein
LGSLFVIRKLDATAWKRAPLLHCLIGPEKDVDIILGRAGDSKDVTLGIMLLSPEFHFSRQILLAMLAQELCRASAEFRIVRQSIEGIPPQKIRLNLVPFKPC